MKIEKNVSKATAKGGAGKMVAFDMNEGLIAAIPPPSAHA